MAAVQYSTAAYDDRRSFAICSDSGYTVGILEGTSSPKSNTILVKHLLATIQDSHHNFTYLHCPSHCGIFGNEVADIAANIGTAKSKEGARARRCE